VDDPEVAEAIADSFLGSLPPEVVDEILADAGRTDYPAGTTVYRGGSPPRAALVIHGLLRVYMASPEGRQITVRYARDSDVLGIAVVVGGPFNVDAQTLAPSSVLDISARALTDVARRDARVSWALAEELDRRLYDTLQQAAINAFGSVKQRVAGHLLDLASDQQRPNGRLVAEVSQQELADSVGSVREVVARVLRELRLAGVVATSTNSVVIIDPAGLHQESGSATPA
jgi:CRP/FNR family transcriptional regulator